MRRVNRKRPIDYILPFLVIIGLGVIVILGFQIWSTFDKQGKADAYFYVVEGKNKVLLYGAKNWENVYSGTKMLLGDAVKTSPIGRSIIAFFNGTLIRMGNDTAVTLTDLNKKFESEKIAVRLDNGVIWVNGKKSPDVKESIYEVRTTHMLVHAKGTVFEVESGVMEMLRVIEGDVSVDIIVKNGSQERVAHTIDVGIGQEIILDEATMKAFEANQSPSVLRAINDSFKTSTWAQWNMNEDQNPTNFAALPGQDGGTDNTTGSMVGTEETVISQTSLQGQLTQAVSDEVNNPDDAGVTITAPQGGILSIEKGPYVIKGTVPAGIQKITVEQVINGKVDSYVLSKFKKGDTEFSYNVSERLGNLLSGENVYSFYAYGEDGQKTSAEVVTLTLAEPVITEALTAPKVTMFNGGTSSVITTDSVKIEGTVQGAKRVVVNGYTLSKFVPGSTTWSYLAKESLGNLKPGENQFEVYAVGADDAKSQIVKFTVTYNKPAAPVTTLPPVTSLVTTTQQVIPSNGF